MTLISLDGAAGTGKSTIYEKLEKKNNILYTPDLGRYFLDKNGWTADTITEDQERQMQTLILATYLGGIKQAFQAKVHAISDASLLTALAYSFKSVPVEVLTKICYEIETNREQMFSLVFPPTIPLEKDGLRHTSSEYRVEIHKKIMEIIREYKIPHHIVLSSTVQSRREEVEEIINHLTNV